MIMHNSSGATSQSESAFAPPAQVFADSVSLTFGNGFVALRNTTLEVEGGSFCTLLGPSGSGKTTLLRVIAGLIAPTTGRIMIGENDVTKVPVQHRDIGFVFQHYALFPHMTVAQNIEYPLRIRRWPQRARQKRIVEILDLVELGHLGDRKIDHLSGGQQQRVAIGRALSYSPKLLLLDEPLGALDRRLRQQLGADLRRIQKQAGTTALYVTHDQDEAFILSDKIAVMDGGRILQDGAPESLYASPSTFFVANFLGETNIIPGQVKVTDGQNVALDASGTLISCRSDIDVYADRRYACSVRPEDIQLSVEQPGADDQNLVSAGAARVADRLFLGSRYIVVMEGSNGQHFIAEATRRSGIPDIGASVFVSWPRSAGSLVEVS